MRIIISHGGVKREIEGNFSICISGADAADLRRCIRAVVGDSDRFYGWIDIYNPPEEAIDNPPSKWTDPG